jgi:hypothetical protein
VRGECVMGWNVRGSERESSEMYFVCGFFLRALRFSGREMRVSVHRVRGRRGHPCRPIHTTRACVKFRSIRANSKAPLPGLSQRQTPAMPALPVVARQKAAEPRHKY